MRKLTTGFLLLYVLSACSDYEPVTPRHKNDTENCISKFQSKIYFINNYLIKDATQPNNEFQVLFFKERDAYRHQIDEINMIRQTMAQTGKLHKQHIEDEKFICKFDSLEEEFGDEFDQAKKRFDAEQMEITLKGVDAMNRQIDQALDDVINDYKKKAVEHKITNRGGLRIDMFVMQDGSVVYCKTTVRDAGKAVDCN